MTAAAGSVVAVAAMAPGVPQLVNTVTGAGPILYRLMWMAVLPVLVGVLATAPLPVDRFAPAVRRTVAVAVPAALAALLVVGGQLVWSRATTLQDGPRWKFPTRQLSAAAWVGKLYDGPGPVLAPWRLMRALALTTTEVHAVDPRASTSPASTSRGRRTRPGCGSAGRCATGTPHRRRGWRTTWPRWGWGSSASTSPR